MMNTTFCSGFNALYNRNKYLVKFTMMVITFTVTLFGFCNPTIASNWYVDNAAVGSKNGTSWQNAWTTFSSIVWGSNGVKSGDILFISGGSSGKTYNSPLNIGASGTSDISRITIRVGQDPGHDGAVTITGNGSRYNLINADSRHYITIDGSVGNSRRLKVYNTSNGGDDAGILVMSANHFVIRNLEIEKVGIGIYATYGTGGVIQNCYLHDVRGDAGIRFNARNFSVTPTYDLTIVEY
ncbi:MAG TPA: hypothetical protein VLH16_01860, partial [Bacteroidales bacterium]|nr:hypothetical protein [Bacteroidales bacterium]